MPRLTALPTEIFQMILRHVDSSSLWRTLSVSREWYQLAEPVCYENISLLITGPNPRWLPQRAKSQDLFKRHVRTFTVAYEFPWNTFSPEWFKTRSDLLKLLRRCRNLNTLRLTSFRSLLYDAYHERSILNSAICDNVSLLTGLGPIKLEIDILGFPIDDTLSWMGDRPHLCSNIARLVPHLWHLRLRLPYLCSHLFDFPDDDYDQSLNVSSLRTIIINTAHAPAIDWPTSFRTTRRCDYSGLQRGETLCAHLEATLRDRFPRMPNLEYARLIWHDVPSLEIFARDVITCQRAKISGLDWEEPGETIPDKAASGDDDSEHDLFNDDETDGGDDHND